MKCPHCGAELQENAHFCLYCMEPLEEATELPTPAPRRKRRLLWLLLPAIACCAAVVFLFLRPGEEPAPTEGETHAPTQLTTTEAATEPEPTMPEPTAPKESITNANAFWSDALSVTSGNEPQLWSPASLYLVEETATMQRYVLPLKIPEAAYSLYFIDGGSSVLAAVTGLTEETIADGMTLAEDTIRTIYYATGYDGPSLADAPAAQESETSLLDTLQLPDPVTAPEVTALEHTDLDSTIPDGLDLPPLKVSIEKRTRTENDITFYDIFLYFYTE